MAFRRHSELLVTNAPCMYQASLLHPAYCTPYLGVLARECMCIEQSSDQDAGLPPANEKRGITNPGKANILRRLAPLNNEDRVVGVFGVCSLSVVYYCTEYIGRLSMLYGVWRTEHRVLRAKSTIPPSTLLIWTTKP